MWKLVLSQNGNSMDLSKIGRHKDQKVVWVGWFWEHSGYAAMNRSYVRGLHNLGWNMGIETINCPLEISEEEFHYFNNLRNFYPNGNTNVPDLFLDPEVIKVVCWIPLKGIPRFKSNIIYTMMESRSVGDFFIKTCSENYDVCWTPTEYYSNQMQEDGLSIPSMVVPIGVDDIYKKENVKENLNIKYKVFSKRRPIPGKPEGFKFLSVFRWNYRKGPDVLIKAFLREFTYKDDVSLVIMSKHAAASREKRFSDAVEAEICQLVEEFGNDSSAPIYWSDANIPYEDMPTMYAMGDCFCLPSRGEGLGLPCLEASRMGLPTILPHHTGLSDYVTDNTSFTFDTDGWEVCDNNPKWSSWVTRVYSGQEFPIFGESVINEVAGLMREVKDNPRKSEEKVEKMNKVIDEKYTWDKCIKKASDYFCEILR